MHRYWYPRVSSGGYRWNMLARIYNAIREPVGSGGDVDGRTYLEFPRELTTAEQAAVAAIMADNPTFPPKTSNSKGSVRDVWAQKTYFEEKIGLPCDLYYSESVVGSGNVDQIELHFKKTLTTTEKNKVKTEYANLCSLV